ncbi:hypothetical protein [Mycobacterium sp. 1274761.0]|uniref:hypothetical protein n=1 Tax=Mycobacterium sp. 1274761.0 TaxID=1834077 RepID=UPI0007FD7C65|nr:hypothetical protein [Mycobacterium sp. 1274761.0]OBK71343.1 hypothetical protein A5651_18665 [Mycobacterium sp. 1274761.0]
MSSPQDRFAGDPEPGTRDTGSDKPSGGEDRPSGTYQGDESVPTHGEESDPGFETKFTNEPPRDVEAALPPYEGRKAEADSGFTEAQGARTGGATGPTGDPEYKSPAPGQTSGGTTASPADEQPASRGSESDTDDDAVGPAHTAGTGRGEDKR